MSPVRILGHLLLWLGFLAGAFVAVRSSEVAETPWVTIQWTHYGLALLVAVAGVVLLRSTSQAETEHPEHHASNISELLGRLNQVLRVVRDWQSESGRLEVFDYHLAIDRDLMDELAAFAERRTTFAKAFGLQWYARIMTEFALAERSINRMWSASADGYIDEVNACLERATRHLEMTVQRIHEAQQAAGQE